MDGASKLAVVTYAYPQGMKYSASFVEALKQQGDREFSLIVFNDSVKDIAVYFESFGNRTEVVDVSGTPTEIRIKSFDHLYQHGPEYIVFLDIDDSMSSNRVEVMRKLLSEYELVSNDLDLMDEKGEVYKRSVWSARLNDRFHFDYKFIGDKNIVGIGNSAIRKSVLKNALKYSPLAKVGDWFIFYQLMFAGKLQAVFTTQCQTRYRQHPENIAGVKEADLERIKYVCGVKKAHYQALNAIGFDCSAELAALHELGKKQDSVHTGSKREDLFWWEETNLLNN